MASCKHQFLALKHLIRHTKMEGMPGAPKFYDEEGTLAGCILCGEIRTLWETGKLTIIAKLNAPSPNENQSGGPTSD